MPVSGSASGCQGGMQNLHGSRHATSGWLTRADRWNVRAGRLPCKVERNSPCHEYQRGPLSHGCSTVLIIHNFALMLDRVIDDVEPAEDAVKDHPKNGMIEAP